MGERIGRDTEEAGIQVDFCYFPGLIPLAPSSTETFPQERLQTLQLEVFGGGFHANMRLAACCLGARKLQMVDLIVEVQQTISSHDWKL